MIGGQQILLQVLFDIIDQSAAANARSAAVRIMATAVFPFASRRPPQN
jgi:hypothetical protein